MIDLPDETVVDGEIVAFDQDGRPSFTLLQNYDASATPLGYFVFDVLVLGGRDVTREPLAARQALLESKVLPHLAAPVRYVAPLEGSLQTLVHSASARVRGAGGQAPRQPLRSGERSGAWRKMRVNQGQEFVIGGYTPGTRAFDALVIGYYQDGQLLYAARTRNVVTALRVQVFRKFKGLETDVCPFANLPEKKGGRWGEGLTAKKMAECRWLKPVLVGQFEFLEWTADRSPAPHALRGTARRQKRPPSHARGVTGGRVRAA